MRTVLQILHKRAIKNRPRCRKTNLHQGAECESKGLHTRTWNAVRHSKEAAHGKGNRLSVHAGDDLAGHVADLIIGIAFAIPGTLFKSRQLTQRVIGKGAGDGLPIRRAFFADDVAVAVVAVGIGNLCCARRNLRQQIVHRIVTILGCQCAGRGASLYRFFILRALLSSFCAGRTLHTRQQTL